MQKVNALLQNSGLVHFPGVARQHGTQLLDEDIELVSALLLRLVSGHTEDLNTDHTFSLNSLGPGTVKATLAIRCKTSAAFSPGSRGMGQSACNKQEK